MPLPAHRNCATGAKGESRDVVLDRFRISAIVFGCIFGAAATGMLLGPILATHFDVGTQSLVNTATGLIVGLTAITIGLLIAGAKNAFDFGATELKAISARFLLLDGFLVQYGVATSAARESLRGAITEALRLLRSTKKVEVTAEFGMAGVFAAILSLTPQNEKEAWLKSSALSLCTEIAISHLNAFMNLSSELEPLLLIALVTWLSSIFLSFGLFAPHNLVAVITLLMTALLMTSAVFLTLELYAMPILTFAHLRTKPLQMTLDQIANP